MVRILKHRLAQTHALNAHIREDSIQLQQALHALSQEVRKSKGRGNGEPGQ